MAKKTLLIFNIVYCSAVVVCLFFVSLFSLGSREQIHQLVTQQPMSYFLSRMLADLTFIAVLMLISWLLNLIAARSVKAKGFPAGKVILTETLVCTVFAVGFVVMSMYHAG